MPPVDDNRTCQEIHQELADTIQNDTTVRLKKLREEIEEERKEYRESVRELLREHREDIRTVLREFRADVMSAIKKARNGAPQLTITDRQLRWILIVLVILLGGGSIDDAIRLFGGG